MKKILFIFALVAIVASAGFSQTSVSITNSTSYNLWGLYTSGTDGDLLPTSTLNSGYFTTLTYPSGYDCNVDIYFTYYDYNTYTEYTIATFSNIDICDVYSLTLYDSYYELNGNTYYYD